MDYDTKQRNFNSLPERIQVDIKQLLLHDQFQQAKELYERWLNSRNLSSCFH